MKYQEALNRIAKYCGANNGSMLEDDLKTLQELADKETPKEGIIDDVYEDGSFGCSCPNCRMYLPSYKTNRCSSCGQVIKQTVTLVAGKR